MLPASGIRLSTLLAALLGAALCIVLYVYGGPFRFKENPIYPGMIAVLRSGAASGASWASTPEGCAFEYLDGNFLDGDGPRGGRLEITVLSRDSSEAEVVVIDRRGDDSTYCTYNRLRMRYDDGTWIRIRHRAAWKGRGRIGWAIEPTL